MTPWRWFAAAGALFLLGAAVWWLSGVAWLAGLGVLIFALYLWMAKRHELKQIASKESRHLAPERQYLQISCKERSCARRVAVEEQFWRAIGWREPSGGARRGGKGVLGLGAFCYPLR